MALSGSFNTSTYSNTYFTFNWSATQNISSNTSTISWWVVCHKSTSGYYYCHWTIVADGATRSSVDQGSRVQVKDGQTIASGSFTVTHNDAGKRSFSASVSAAPYAYAMNCTGSGSWSLNDIPRAPTVSFTTSDLTETSVTVSWTSNYSCNKYWYSLNGGTNWSDEQSITAATSGTFVISNLTPGTKYQLQFCARNKDVNSTAGDGYSGIQEITTYNYPYIVSTPDFNIPDNNFTVTLYNPLGHEVNVRSTYSSNGSTVNLYSNTAFTSESYTVSLTNTIRTNLYNSIPNSSQGTYTTNLTYSTQTTKTSTGNYKVTSDSAPTIGTATYTEGMTSFNNFKNPLAIVQNKSTVIVTVGNISVKDGATVTGGNSGANITILGNSYTLTYNATNNTYSNTEGFSINSRTNVVGVINVRDSRGISVSQNLNIIVLPYDNPTITYEVERDQNYYSETDITPYAVVTSLGQYGLEWEGEVGNAPIVFLSAEAIPSSAEEPITGYLVNNQTNQWVLNNEYSWTLNFRVDDRFGTRIFSSTTLSRGIPLIFIDTDKNSVGIEQFPTHNSSLEVTGSIYLNGQEIGSGDVTATPVGQGEYEEPLIQIENGGTGARTVAAARNALGLGNTSGALPIANGGTGQTTALAAIRNLIVTGCTEYNYRTTTTSNNVYDDAYGVQKIYTANQDGMVAITCSIWVDKTSDYGAFKAQIFVNNVERSKSQWRMDNAQTQIMGASASLICKISQGQQIKMNLGSSHNGTKTCEFTVVAIGCTLS